jgi:hypothetical protein
MIFIKLYLSEIIRETGTDGEAYAAYFIGEHCGCGSCPNAASGTEGEFQIPSFLIISVI